MLNLRDASEEDIQKRLAELKSDLVEITEGNRSVDDAGLEMILQEAAVLDGHLMMGEAEERRAKARIAATAGAMTGSGIRSLGDEVMTEDWMKFVTSGRAGVDGFRQEFTGDNGKALSHWLQAAGTFGARAITEWASGGPPTFDSTDSGGLLPVGQPIAPVPRRARLYMRDLIPTIPTTLATVPYVRELNPTTGEGVTGGGANTVAEGSTKPSANLSFVSVQAPVSTIATTLTLSKQMFEDAPAVIAYINQRLPYLVKFAEDAQILTGNGTWPNMTGINNTAGVQTQTATSGESAITLANAFAKVENSDGMPSAVVMNPTDAWAMFSKRAAGGAGTFDAGTPFDQGFSGYVWGVPVYRSRAYAAGTALVGDFQLGAMLADRQQVNTETFRERYAEQNVVLLICEERLALLVLRPDLFVKTTIS